MLGLEYIAAILGFIGVYLTVKQNIWCWPIGILMALLYLGIFFNDRLYADAGLQVIYVLLQGFGWYEWVYGGGKGKQLQVTRSSRTLLIGLVIGGVLGSVALGWGLSRWTNQDLSYWDSSVTVFSLIAQWMVAEKKFENWYFWFFVDVNAIGLYLVKKLYPTTVLYVLFLGLAAMGYREWKKAMEGAVA